LPKLPAKLTKALQDNLERMRDQKKKTKENPRVRKLMMIPIPKKRMTVADKKRAVREEKRKRKPSIPPSPPPPPRPPTPPPPPPKLVVNEDRCTDYAKQVVAKKIIAGPYVRAACERHLRDLKEAKKRELSWDVESAERACGFFEDVLTVEVEKPNDSGANESRVEPFHLEPWECFIVGSLFGWRTSNGLRRFRRAYIEIGKGNGKSPLAAGIGHYMLTALKKIRAEIYAAATTADQAAIMFRDAVSMYERSPGLASRLVASGVNPVWQLSDMTTASFFKPISADKRGKSGIRPYAALIDEIHEHPDNTVIEMLRAGTKGNQDALIFEITNSGFDKKTVCWQEHQYSIEVSMSIKDNDAWFAYVCAVDEGDEPFEDESCWIKANPNLGVSIHPTYVREQVAEAKGMPSKEGWVRRLHFCQWTESETTAIPYALWLKAKLPEPLDCDQACELYGRPYGGLDLSRVRDLSAFTLTWLVDSSLDRWQFLSKTWFWTPKDTIHERSKKDRAPYDEWAKRDFLEAVDGPRISYKWVASALADLCSRYDPQVIGCDQYGLEQLQDQLDDIGVSLPCIVHPQGFNRRVIDKKIESVYIGETGAEEVALWMPDSINKLEAALLENRIKVDPNPAMDMCAHAVVFEQNRIGHRMFNKDKAPNRIDGMVSLSMSIGVATVKRIEIDISSMIG
jgi:phage terminase large subunit-like protein